MRRKAPADIGLGDRLAGSRMRSVARCVLGPALGSAMLASLAMPASAATPDQFVARTTADIVALCSTEPSNDNYVAAIHFCHGLATGAYQYYLSLASASEPDRFVCPPDPPPSRSQAIEGFVAWAGRHVEYVDDPPVGSLFRYLGQAYPCGH